MCKILRWASLLWRGLSQLVPVRMASSASGNGDSRSNEDSSNESLINSKPVNQAPDVEKGFKDHDAKKRESTLDFDNMPLDEKRSYYRCGRSFVTLDQILTWPEYVKKNHNLFIKKGFLTSDSKFSSEKDGISEKVSLWQGDITCLEIDAIVNAANTSLRGGGGVDGCIHRAAGSRLLEECIKLKGCKTGGAKITSGYKLPAKKVIHTVGPIGEMRNKLQNCYKSCLRLVNEHNLKTIAFCCVSTGIYGYPNDKAAVVAVTTAKEWLAKNKDSVDCIIFCVYLPTDLEIYSKLMLKHFPCTVTTDNPNAKKLDKSFTSSEGNKAVKDVKDEEKRKEQPTVLVDSSGNGNLPAGQDPADAQLTALTANVPVEDGDKGSSVESPSEDTGGNAVGCEDQGAEEEDASAAKGLVTRDETKTVEGESIEESSPQSAREKDEIIDEDQKRKKRREDVDGDQGMDVDGETDEHKSEMVEEVVSNDHEAEDTIGNQSGKDDTGITVDEERSKL